MRVSCIMHRGATPAPLARGRVVRVLLAGGLLWSCASPSARGYPAAGVATGSVGPVGVGREITAMMARSAAAWNRGDLDAFVEDYAPGEGTTYIGRLGLIRGRRAIREAYAPRFIAGARHDSLSFELADVDVLGENLVHVIAYYMLSRGDSVTGRGPTSLVMRRDETGRWRIVHDHSS